VSAIGRATSCCVRISPIALVVLAAMAPSAAAATLREKLSGPSPFTPQCSGPEQGGLLYPNAEVEPWVAANPATRRNLVAVWQQDRWSNGGARGLLSAYSLDGGRSWARSTAPPFAHCEGGTAANGGDYQRASDPWVSIGPDGSAHQVALGFNATDATTAILVSSSRDRGRTWGPVKTLERDTTANRDNDKETVTADPTDPRYVYATWVRFDSDQPSDPDAPFAGIARFARSTDGGRTWSPARTIVDLPKSSFEYTQNNQIVVLGDGTLVHTFYLGAGAALFHEAQRSTDKGRTWSTPMVVDAWTPSDLTPQGGVVDLTDGHPVRDGLPAVAADPRPGSRTLYLAWSDVRFTVTNAPPFRNQIVLAASFDGGLTWTRPRLASSNLATQAFTPSLAVNKHGVLAVSYFDFTFDTLGGPLATDRWMTTSADGGTSFTPRRRLTEQSFDMRMAPDASGLFVGDYEGLAPAKRRFDDVFVAANNGKPANRTDVFSVAPPSLTTATPEVAAPSATVVRAPATVHAVRPDVRRR